MPATESVAVFWDYENCSVPSSLTGYEVVNAIRRVAQEFGSVTLFKAYLEVSDQVLRSRSQSLRAELQASGVSLTDCPHNGRKDVADKMMLVDMLAYAIDHPAPTTFLLISGDRDFSYALSILRLRRYRVILITNPNAHPSLTSQASLCLSWVTNVLVNSSVASSPKKDSLPLKRFNIPTGTSSRRNSLISPINEASPADFTSDPDSTLVMQEAASRKRALARARFENRTSGSAPATPAPEEQPRSEAPSTFFGSPFRLPVTPLVPQLSDSGMDRKGKGREAHVANGSSENRPEDSLSASEDYRSEADYNLPQTPQENTAYHNSSLWNSPRPPPSVPASPSRRASRPESRAARMSVRSSSASPTKSTRTDTSETPIPLRYIPLVRQLQLYRSKGVYIPQRSALCIDLSKNYKRVYQNAGVDTFADYIEIAEQEGFVTLGGGDGLNPWIMLRQEWVNTKC